MGGDDVRKSRQPVNFRADGGGWIIRASVDENSPPPHLLAARSLRGFRAMPELRVTTSPEGLRPPPTAPVAPVARPPRKPLVPIEHLVFVNEIKSLETELGHARRHIVVQNHLIKGFCQMQASALV